MRKYAYIFVPVFVSCICNAELAQIEDMDMENFSIEAENALVLKGVEPKDVKTLTVQEHSIPVSTTFEPQVIALDVVEVRNTGHSFYMAPIEIQINVN